MTVNFLTQLLGDLLSAKYVDRIGYRAAAVENLKIGLLAAAVFPLLILLGLGRPPPRPRLETAPAARPMP